MPGVISNRVRIPVPVGGEEVILICRRPTAAETSGFLSRRFTQHGRKVKSKLYEAREELMAQILVDAENAEYETKNGERKPLNAQTVLSDEDKAYWSGILGKTVFNWFDLIPLSWLSSAAMTFEDSAPDGEEEQEKN
jgi:hypothetical protein